MLHRIGLGTVQFGSHYGATNNHGRPSRKECEKIVETALDAGIIYFDTAAYYGDADLILASCLPRGVRVVSKANNPQEILHSIELFEDNLYALCGLLWKAIWPKMGKSIYWPDSVDTDLHVVQMPLNLADQRNLRLLHWCKDNDMEVHARSVFLQGRLLEHATVRQCLKFVLDQPVDVAIVGVNTADELKEIIEAVETLDQETEVKIPVIEDLDPRTWGQHAHH